MSGAALVSRRQFLAVGGALVVSFSLFPRALVAQQIRPRRTPGVSRSFQRAPLLDSWIRVAADGSITVFTGKAELGQGIKTAIQQIAAEQLTVDMARISMVTADTQRTPNEGYTAGSRSMEDSGTAVLNAAAQVREILMAEAAKRFGVALEQLTVADGEVRSHDGRRIGYGALVAEQTLHVQAQPQSKLKDPKTHTVMGKPILRVDIPGKVTGGLSYVQDLRLPGMVHARVMRPPSYGARLQSLVTSTVEKMPGVVKVLRNANYVAVIAVGEWQAIEALRALRDTASWDEDKTLPLQRELYSHIQQLKSEATVIFGAKEGQPNANIAQPTMEAVYYRPYQMHGAIGPSCAVALYQDDKLTVWTHGQGVYPLREAIADLLGMPAERVHCIHMEGSGCYGHNGADDAGADAALIARALPGRPVRVQWTREDEHAWEPFGPAMVTKARAALDSSGGVTAWHYEVWSNTHSTRPSTAGALMPAWHLQKGLTPPPPKAMAQPEGGGDRNAVPLYKFANAQVTNHFIPDMPLRVSALRALGAYMNVFSIESFIDELARAARADTVEFRLRHLDDPRAQEVVRVAAERFGWGNYQPKRGRGRGFAFARYKNLAAYAAIAMEVDVERETGEVHVTRVVCAVDSGDAVNPDGIRNQIEGGIVQSISWTLFESVTFDETRITSRDWSSYPILRFSHVPRSIEVHVMNRPGQPFLGTGEAAQGPAAGALANAVADATGVRIRELPLNRARVKATLGA